MAYLAIDEARCAAGGFRPHKAPGPAWFDDSRVPRDSSWQAGFNYLYKRGSSNLTFGKKEMCATLECPPFFPTAGVWVLDLGRRSFSIWISDTFRLVVEPAKPKGG